MKTWTDDATAQVKRYLRQVQVRLEESGADAHEVVEDLSRHIHQRANDSPLVVITLDEANRIIATMGTPDEVALSWKQLGGEDKSEGWDSPALNPPPSAQKLSQRTLWVMLGIVFALLAALLVVPWMVWSISTAPDRVTTAGSTETKNELIEAARNGHPETLQSLLDHGALIDAQDAQGMTALHHAAKNGHNGVVEVLVQNGANKTIRDRMGKTAADYAASGGHQATLEAIVGKLQSQPAETLTALPPTWFQAGNDHMNYVTGVKMLKGIPGEAMFIQSTNAKPAGFSTVMTEQPADQFRGRRITMTGTISANVRDGWAGMWLRIDGPQGEALGFDNMQDRPIKGTIAPTPYSITLDVPDTAAQLAYGVLFEGQGEICFGDISVR
ncbi:MAG: ankyrin repeat domain-containing protein [Candidatus Hydrogenedentes bacterium]|nr:ankyrin repeat domain-containing protein [Candidatus Hydrogenedentota bacterium]